jgi:hypothetical protein
MHRHVTRITLAALALVALGGSSAVAAPKSPHHLGKGHPGIRLGVSKPTGGTTILTVDSGTLAAIAGSGVSVTPFGTATASSSGTQFTFPITGGRVVYVKRNHGHGAGRKLLSGFVVHGGSGLTLSKSLPAGVVSATVSGFRINLSADRTGRIDAKVGTTKLKLAKLTNVAVDASSKSVTALATLTPAAVTALNGAFGTNLPKTGAALGTIVIAPTF